MKAPYSEWYSFDGFVVSEPFIENKRKKVIVECKKCNERRAIRVEQIKTMKRPLCKKCSSSTRSKHGFHETSLYSRYEHMMDRCYNKKHKWFKNYGGKGVTVCDEWRNSPEKFIQWSLLNGYRDDLVVDKDILCEKLKIYPKVYSPKTCLWISKTENDKHREIGSNNTTGYRGVSYDKCKGVYRCYVDRNKKRILDNGGFSTAEEAKKYRDDFISNTAPLA